MKTPLLIFILLIPFLAFCQPCKDKYKDKLEPNSKLVNCTGNSTVEVLDNGTYVMKRYFPETRQITFFASYTSKNLKELFGPYMEFWDDGTLVYKGMYENNQKTGTWIESIHFSGLYQSGKREGEWKKIVNDTLKEVSHYKTGELHGEKLKYDSLGNISLKEVYDNGTLVSSTGKPEKKKFEEAARFPGCEDMGLDKEELNRCAQKKLLEYLYGNMRYPAKSRKDGVQGKALLQFVIDRDGDAIDIKVLNGVDEAITKVIISLVENMPKWRPGMLDGKPVKMLYTVPVSFKLE